MTYSWDQSKDQEYSAEYKDGSRCSNEAFRAIHIKVLRPQR